MGKTLIDRFATRWHTLWVRYPAYGWLRDWGVSGASICSGLATLLLFRRGIEYFPMVIGYLLLLWLMGVLLAERRQRLVRQAPRGGGVGGGQWLWFLLVLVAAAILTTLDPWYRAATGRFRWLESILVGLGLFAALAAWRACWLSVVGRRLIAAVREGRRLRWGESRLPARRPDP